MNYVDLMVRYQYCTDDESIPQQLLVPCLTCTSEYRLTLNHLDIQALHQLFASLVGMARAKGILKVVYYPLDQPEDDSMDDSELYKHWIQNAVETRIREFFSKLEIMDLKILQEIVNAHLIQVQYGHSVRGGSVFDQISILTDHEDNSFVFRGGLSAVHPKQYEQIRVFRSWKAENQKYVLSEIKAFDDIWDHQSAAVHLVPFDQTLSELLKKIIIEKEKADQSSVIKLRDYQEEAKNAWLEHKGRGFFVMATGTGKTWTAIYSAKELMEKEKILPIIVAPYKHLIKQWGEDLRKAFPDACLIYVSSENPDWSVEIKNEIIHSKYDESMQLIIISTIASFQTDRFREAISGYTGKKLLIVDEAHRFTHPVGNIQEEYQYMLGLSATPYRGKNAESGKQLMDFFGGQVYNLPIDLALQKKCLVPYTYHPVYVHSTAEEELSFANYTQKIPSCFNSQGVCINPDYLVTLLRSRLRVIAMAEAKLQKLDEFLTEHDRLSHFVVYCGDGKVLNGSDQEKRHIEIVRKMLYDHGYTAAQFTAQESMQDRMHLISAFDKGIFNALAAIRCLDEGVNIPSIESALILASNDDYREFVQRRGRILRKNPGKSAAKIYDLVVLPSLKAPGIAAIELRRFAEYARLADNRSDLKPELERLKAVYNLSDQEINVFEFEEQGEMIDE